MRPFGTLPARSGVWMMVASGLVGLIGTVLAHSEPGDLLGLFVIVGTLVAAFAVRTDAAHLIIPIPAFVYLGAGLIAGLIHDRAVDTSRTAMLVHAVQWIAAGFLAIAAATLLAIAITVARRLRTRSPAGGRRRAPAGYQQRRDAGRPDVGRPDVGHPNGGRRAPVPGDQEWHYLYDREPEDRPDAHLRSPRRYR